jgi:hypothetical protein
VFASPGEFVDNQRHQPGYGQGGFLAIGVPLLQGCHKSNGVHRCAHRGATMLMSGLDSHSTDLTESFILSFLETIVGAVTKLVAACRLCQCLDLLQPF